MDHVTRRQQKRNEYLELLGGRCKSCGSTEKLEFDHIDPKQKRFSIGGNINKKRELVLDELKRCQLLCNPCHWNKTRADFGTQEHGHGAYTNKNCRCDTCRKSWAAYTVSRRKKHKMLQ